MQTTTSRRTFLAGTLATLVLGLAACSSTDGSTSSSTSSAATSTSSASSAAATGADSPSLDSLVAEVQGSFQQFTYTDPDTGLEVPYNLFIPANYDASTSYPLLTYIADSSLVGQDVTAPLSQYGALIWASAAEQAKHASLVLVPEYPEVIIDDHGSYTTTDYVELTARLIASVQAEYSVDPDRVYGTGQSMGAMTMLLLAAEHPDLFAAEMFVSGQWDVSQLAGLAGETFVYTAAGGDENASGGQDDVAAMLDSAGVSYSRATDWDATWSAEQDAAAAADLFSAGDAINIATFATGTVLEGSTASGPMNSEHMASFQPAYEITALRDWLFGQTAS